MTLALSVGDPAGIGPEIAVKAALACPEEELLLFGDEAFFQKAFASSGVPSHVTLRHIASYARLPEGASPECGRIQLDQLDAAISAVLAGEARAIVTGPTSKEAVTSSGHYFTGQTEHLAERCSLPRDAVTMLFLGPRMKVGLVTTHLSIKEVPAAITPARVRRSIDALTEAIFRLGVSEPNILLCGLNPHAGEGGLLGDEEIALREAMPGIDPQPAEAVLRAVAEGRADGAVTMFHDQATIASKLLDWGEAVNVTWGLPFVRTSVDHGVAYDIAGKGIADPEGLIAAIRMARQLSA